MMASKPVWRNPHVPQKSPLLYRLVNPTSVGVATAAGLAVTPRLLGRSPLPVQLFPETLSRLPQPLLLALLGFPIGYLCSKTADWLRWKVIKHLLAYQGWVYGARSLKNKAWATLLALLEGKQTKETYDFQRCLPNQPLPELDSTLNLWLQVAEQVVTKEEFEQTKEHVERFRQNEGPKIQGYLRNRFNNKVNWLSEYWMTAAYLGAREPTPIFSNYCVTNKKPEGTTFDQLAKAAATCRTTMEFYEYYMQRRITPVTLMDLVPLCMNGYRYIFNGVRVPGEHIDMLQRYPEDTHIVVLRKGHYYQVEMYVGESGRKRLLRAEEIKMQLQRICDHVEGLEDELPVAALTTMNRSVWAKKRLDLAKKNAETLRTIEGCLFMLCLDENSPKDIHETCKLSLTGRGNDRWYDKCYTEIVFPTCAFGGNIEHSGVDGMVYGTLAEYIMLEEKYVDGDIERTPEGPNQNICPPIRLNWDLDYMKDDILKAFNDYSSLADKIDMYLLNTEYGKGVMKKARISPDGYLQMALQLAYYTLHQETPKTYEPSTTRMYALGRTENIHPVSSESRVWVRMMKDPLVSKQVRREQLKKAVNCQNEARLRATIGQGCDRHLLGLLCASREMGMDLPTIFMDKAWTMAFKLSTSQTPTKTAELGAGVDYGWVTGGFGPNCEDGYGMCYVFMGDDIINISITTWKTCEKTSSTKMAAAVTDAFAEMKELVSS